MKLRTAVNMHINRQMVDLFLIGVVPFFVMFESGYACGWSFAGGHVNWVSLEWYFALVRGFLLEVLIFAMFLIVHYAFTRRLWGVMVFPLLIGLVVMPVSAVLNIGWAMHSGDMKGIASLVDGFLPQAFIDVFKLALGLIFPVAVAGFALFDTLDLVQDTSEKVGRVGTLLLTVENAERHRDLYRKKQQECVKEVEDQYTQMAKADAQNMVNRVKQSDYSFGLSDLPSSVPSRQSGATRVTPVGQQLPPLSSHSQLPSPAMTGQFRTVPPFQGMPTTPLQGLNGIP